MMSHRRESPLLYYSTTGILRGNMPTSDGLGYYKSGLGFGVAIEKWVWKVEQGFSLLLRGICRNSSLLNYLFSICQILIDRLTFPVLM